MLAVITPALRSTSASAILSSSAIAFGSSHQDLDNRDENHPMAVRVNATFGAPTRSRLIGSHRAERLFESVRLITGGCLRRLIHQCQGVLRQQHVQLSAVRDELVEGRRRPP
jgi:hypothetical protein